MGCLTDPTHPLTGYLANGNSQIDLRAVAWATLPSAPSLFPFPALVKPRFRQGGSKPAMVAFCRTCSQAPPDPPPLASVLVHLTCPCHSCATWSRMRAVPPCKLDLTLVPTGPSPGLSLSLLLVGHLAGPHAVPGTPSSPTPSPGWGLSPTHCALCFAARWRCAHVCVTGARSLNGTISFSTASLGVGSPCAAAGDAWLEAVLSSVRPQAHINGSPHGTVPSLGHARWDWRIGQW